MYKLYSQCSVSNSKFPVPRWAFVASLCSCVPFNDLLGSIKMPEPSSHTNHSAEVHWNRAFPSLLPVFCGAFCIAPIAICTWVIDERTPNLANVDEKFQTKAGKTVCILSFCVLEVFAGFLVFLLNGLSHVPPDSQALFHTESVRLKHQNQLLFLLLSLFLRSWSINKWKLINLYNYWNPKNISSYRKH